MEILRRRLPAFVREPNRRRYESDNYVVIDFETTNLDYGSPYNPDNRLLLAVGISGRGERKVSWGNEYEQGDFVQWLLTHEFIIAQNLKFEAGWLARMGLPLEKLLGYCTVIGEYVLDGNRQSKRDLDSLAKRYDAPVKESVVSTLIKAGVSPENIPKPWLEDYCVQDVLTTKDVFVAQRAKLMEYGLLPHVQTRCLLTPVLVDMEFIGMHLDPNRVKKMYQKVVKEYNDAKTRLEDFAGGINLNSPKQKAEYIYDRLGFRELTDHRGNPIRTEAGGRSTDKEDIGRLEARSDDQREFLKLFGTYTELNADHKYLSKFYKCVTEGDGILRAYFNQTVTATHRLSSTGGEWKVQLQNMKRDLKPLFCPRHPGWKSGEADFKQLEFRAAVELGDDDVGRQKIAEGFDVHQFTSDTLTEAGEPTDRQGAKQHTFKPLYGGTSGTPAQQAYYRAFREMYPGIAGTQEHWKATVLRDKVLVLPTGFRFYWPYAKVTRSGYMEFGEQVCNYPVQHLATAEFVPIGVLYTWHYMKAAGMRGFLVNTIHDSLISEVPEEETELFRELAVQGCSVEVPAYMRDVYGMELSVPLDVDIGINTHWAEKKGWAEKHLGEAA